MFECPVTTSISINRTIAMSPITSNWQYLLFRDSDLTRYSINVARCEVLVQEVGLCPVSESSWPSEVWNSLVARKVCQCHVTSEESNVPKIWVRWHAVKSRAGNLCLGVGHNGKHICNRHSHSVNWDPPKKTRRKPTLNWLGTHDVNIKALSTRHKCR